MTHPVIGNTRGLKASDLKLAERAYRRRVYPTEVISIELAGMLCEFSQRSRRQIGVMIDRRGEIDSVIVGEASKLMLPDVGRLRASRGRLRGIRLVHTHLRGEALTNDDLTDLALLRLDLVGAITFTADGVPKHLHCAHLIPVGVAESADRANKPWMILEPLSVHDGTLDVRELITSLEEEFAHADRNRSLEHEGNRAVLVHVHTKNSTRSSENSLAELRELCRTAGVVVEDVFIQRRPAIEPRFVVGRGKLDEVVLRANQVGAEMLIFDLDLTPAQARAISDMTELKVIDRSMLILDIFALHATTRDGKLQVELAQLRYTLPRLVEKNTMMSRLTGGIGGRGPGETKLEINRRRARERVTRLEEQIGQVAQQRAERRSLRVSKGIPIIAIIGYTNAGKSTLLNALTQGGALVENKLFATLNPTSRRLRFPRDREVIITDTVGFIHELPKELVSAFRATLEELTEADLLLHLVDASAIEYEERIGAVNKIIADLGIADTPSLLVFNKIDRMDEEALAMRRSSFDAIPISAIRKETTRPLLGAIEKVLLRNDRLSEDITLS